MDLYELNCVSYRLLLRHADRMRSEMDSEEEPLELPSEIVMTNIGYAEITLTDDGFEVTAYGQCIESGELDDLFACCDCGSCADIDSDDDDSS